MQNSSETTKSYKILLIGQPDERNIFLEAINLNKGKQNNHYIMKLGETRLDVYTPEFNDSTLYEKADGSITLFNHANIETFYDLPNVIANTIRQVGKMIPTVVVGINILPSSIHDEKISREEVLDYLYKLGDVCTCMIPYFELIEKTTNTTIFSDLITIIECKDIERCFKIAAIRRGKCGIHQFQELSVETT